jgi:methyl-accepting chemotaxis protein
MTKQQLQKELLEKVKLGTKPSDLKKSRSLSDLPKSIPSAEPSRRKSIEPVINQKTLTAQLEKAQDEITTLALNLEIQARELTELNEENSHLKEQVNQKQKDLENLRQQLEEKSQQLALTQTELEESLKARHQSLKDFGSEHSKRVQSQQELASTVEESAEELVSQDEKITELRNQVIKLTQANQNLQRDLDLASRLAESRKVPYFENEFNSLAYFQYAVYALFTVGFILTLIRKKEVNNG